MLAALIDSFCARSEVPASGTENKSPNKDQYTYALLFIRVCADSAPTATGRLHAWGFK